jgi:membrane associated rhomboid family serine protease
MNDLNEPPLNPLPPAVWLLAGPMIALEAVFNLGAARIIGGSGAIGWRNHAIESYGVWPAYWRQQADAGAFDLELIARFFTFPYLHLNASHAIFAIVILLALGKFVGDVFGNVATLAVYFVSGAIGALVYASIAAVEQPMFGAYPGDYGLIGAFTYMLWVRGAGTGVQQYRAFSMIGFLLAMQLIFGLLFGGGPDWIADLAAFVAGFILSFAVAPGGIARLRQMMRQR